jgi:uncharacterized membrane protein
MCGNQLALFIPDFKIIVRPNNSLSVENTVKLVCALAAISMLVGIGFAMAGAWMVLPFAGLEIIAIAYAFYYITLHSGDYESIAIEGDRVTVEKHGYKSSTEVVFQRYWAQVSVRDQLNGGNALFICSHGKEVEFGRSFMTDEQRVELARALKLKLKKY